MALVQHPEQWEVLTMEHYPHTREQKRILRTHTQELNNVLSLLTFRCYDYEVCKWCKCFDLCYLLWWLKQLQREAGETVSPSECLARLGQLHGFPKHCSLSPHSKLTSLGWLPAGGLPWMKKTESLTRVSPLRLHIKQGPTSSESSSSERAQVANVPAGGPRSVPSSSVVHGAPGCWLTG